MRLSAAQVAARVLEALEKGERIYTAVVVDSADRAMIGRRWWLSGRRSRGTLGSPALDAVVAGAVTVEAVVTIVPFAGPAFAPRAWFVATVPVPRRKS